jgi:hypothetical protein
MGTWVNGYGSYHPVPVPAPPDGYQFFSFMYPWVLFCPIPALLLGIYPPGTRVMGTHCHPYMGPGRAGGNPGELSPAQLRSSIRASLPGRAQGQFSGELGTAHVSEPAYQTCELLEISVGQGIVGLSRPTKHTLINYLHTSENICLLVYQIALQALRCCNL